MSEEPRVGRMVRLGDVAGRVQGRIEAARDANAEWRAERIADGVRRFGWSPDAACPNCGDAGRWPNSIHWCSCAAARRMQDEIAAAAERERRERAWLEGGVPSRFRRWSLDSHPDADAAALVRAWVHAEDGSNLYLSGPVGSGKTGLAVGALRELWASGAWSLRFAGVPDLLDAMRPGAPVPGPMAGCVGASWVVLDDAGVERPSDWVRERLYVLVNGRYEAERPTILTSNCDLAALAEALGERTVSRLVESVTVVAVDGDDLRRR